MLILRPGLVFSSGERVMGLKENPVMILIVSHGWFKRYEDIFSAGVKACKEISRTPKPKPVYAKLVLVRPSIIAS